MRFALAILLAASFRDAPLELRCDALAAFVGDWAKAHLPKGAYAEGPCAEGSGLGGARYTLDFKTGNDEQRLDVWFKEDGLTEVRFAPKDPALKPLADAATAWLTAKPTAVRIYGQDYGAFVRSFAPGKAELPLGKGAGAKTLVVTLEPQKPGEAETGKATVSGALDAGLLKCFKCDDAKCLGEVRYRFEDRLFALTRDAGEEGPVGAAWVIEGPKPADWRFVCGVSRYSLQKL